jgi:hypothetical protein
MVMVRESELFVAWRLEVAWSMKEFLRALQVASVWDEQVLGEPRVNEDYQLMAIDL